MQFDVLIEVPKGSRNKYEVDHHSGKVKLDRYLFTAMGYPTDYGYIEDTLGEDGDPLDALVLLPEPVQTRRVTSVAPVAQELSFEGHGPHALPLGRTVQHTWLEPQDGSERTPDRWRFTLPAQAPLAIRLGQDVAGEIRPLDGQQLDTGAARISPGQAWRAELPMGPTSCRSAPPAGTTGCPTASRSSPSPWWSAPAGSCGFRPPSTWRWAPTAWWSWRRWATATCAPA